MRKTLQGTAVLLTLGLAACGGEDSEMSALERDARAACVGLGSTSDACDCFVGGVMEAMAEEDADMFLQIFTADEGEALEAVGDDPMAATMILTRLMTEIVPVAAQCDVELDLGIR